MPIIITDYECNHVLGSISNDDELVELIRKEDMTPEIFYKWEFEAHNYCYDCGYPITINIDKLSGEYDE